MSLDSQPAKLFRGDALNRKCHTRKFAHSRRDTERGCLDKLYCVKYRPTATIVGRSDTECIRPILDLNMLRLVRRLLIIATGVLHALIFVATVNQFNLSRGCES